MDMNQTNHPVLPPPLRSVIAAAENEAQGYYGEQPWIGTEHLLLALCHAPECLAHRLFGAQCISAIAIADRIDFILRRGEGPGTSPPGLTPRAREVIRLALDEARKLDSPSVTTGHLLLGMLAEPDGIAGRVLEEQGMTLNAVRDELERLEQLQELEEDLADISLAVARMLTTGPERYSLDEVLAQFGYSREQLRDLAE